MFVEEAVVMGAARRDDKKLLIVPDPTQAASGANALVGARRLLKENPVLAALVGQPDLHAALAGLFDGELHESEMFGGKVFGSHAASGGEVDHVIPLATNWSNS
jgi:hypothetical protein